MIARLGLALIVACALGSLPRSARSQEFEGAAPVIHESAALLLERGLPPAAASARFEAIAVRWFGLDELATSSLAVEGGWRGARTALGVSRTGQAELGWSALAIAGGWADARGGAAVRAVLRGQSGEGGGGTRGIEAGAGAWAAASRLVRVWASAPQLWMDGEAPPLERRLELGVRWSAGEVELWLSHAMAPGAAGDLRGEHAAGVAAHAGPITVWTHVQDAPPRGGFGLVIHWRGLEVACQSDTHPVLGETFRLGIAAGSGAP